MKLIRNLTNNTIDLIENGKIVLEIGFTADEFTYSFYTNKPIIITSDLDKTFYDSLNQLLNNKYYFSHNYSFQEEGLIVWLSDGYCNLESEYERDLVNRLIIRKIDDKIYLMIFNPFYEKNNIEKSFNLVAFSPAGNGFLTSNLKNKTTFQDDMVLAYQKTLFNKRIAKI